MDLNMNVLIKHSMNLIFSNQNEIKTYSVKVAMGVDKGGQGGHAPSWIFTHSLLNLPNFKKFSIFTS